MPPKRDHQPMFTGDRYRLIWDDIPEIKVMLDARAAKLASYNDLDLAIGGFRDAQSRWPDRRILLMEGARIMYHSQRD